MALIIGCCAAAVVEYRSGLLRAQACVLERTGLQPLSGCSDSLALAAGLLHQAALGGDVTEVEEAKLQQHCSSQHQHPASCFADLAFQLGVTAGQAEASRAAAEAAISAMEATCSVENGKSCALKGLRTLYQAGAFASMAKPTASICAALRSAGSCSVGALHGLAPLAATLGQGAAATYLSSLPMSCAQMGVRLPAVSGVLAAGNTARSSAPADQGLDCAATMVGSCPTSTQELLCSVLNQATPAAAAQPAQHTSAALTWAAALLTLVAGLGVAFTLVPGPNKGAGVVRDLHAEEQQLKQRLVEDMPSASTFIRTPSKANLADVASGSGVSPLVRSPSPFPRCKSGKPGSFDNIDLAQMLVGPDGQAIPGVPSGVAGAAGVDAAAGQREEGLIPAFRPE